MATTRHARYDSVQEYYEDYNAFFELMRPASPPASKCPTEEAPAAPTWRALSNGVGELLVERSQAPESLIDAASDLGSEWCSVAGHSEWSAVSAAETEWTTLADDVPLSGEAEAGSWPADETLARSLHARELAQFRGGTLARAAAGSSRRLQRATLELLIERCGLCLVCHESIALVAWEPCGHLACCHACAVKWTEHARGDDRCIVCRCPGAPTGLLRSVGRDSLVRSLSIEASSGALRAPMPDYTNVHALKAEAGAQGRMTKPDLRRLKREMNALGRMRHGVWSVVHGDYQPHPFWKFELRRGRLRPRLVAVSHETSLLKNGVRTPAGQRSHSSPLPASKRRLQEDGARYRAARREMLQEARREVVEQAALLDAVVCEAEAFLSAFHASCHGCGSRSACMLNLSCGHVTHCRSCWLEAAAHASVRCAECAGCAKLAMELYRL